MMIEPILTTAPPRTRRGAELSQVPGFDTALARLAPDDSALLELSFCRHISDDEIAELLQVGADDIDHRRNQALDRLSQGLDRSSTHEPPNLLARGRNGDARRHGGKGAPAAKDSSAVPEVLPSAPPGPRGRLALLLAILATAAVGVIALALSSGGDNGTTHMTPARPATKARSAAVAPLARVGATQGAAGTARLRGSALAVRVPGLPAGDADYEVWLYDSVSDAVPVGRLRGGRLDAPLPKGSSRYRYLDVSREPRDGNANHSGASVLRAPISAFKR
jgi:hypothetical protein